MDIPHLHIVEKIKEGDEAAFRILFEQYYTSLFFYARKFVDEDLARDMVHDVFLSLWQNRERIDIHTSLNAYLFRMVRNRSLQHLEKVEVRKAYADQQEYLLRREEIEYYQESESVKSLIEVELRDQLELALAKLPERCEEVFRFSRFRGYKNAEIAEELGISIKAVEKQISKALKILRVELKDYLPLILYFSMLSGSPSGFEELNLDDSPEFPSNFDFIESPKDFE